MASFIRLNWNQINNTSKGVCQKAQVTYSGWLHFEIQECIPVGCVPAERWPYSGGEPPQKIGDPPEKLEEPPGPDPLPTPKNLEEPHENLEEPPGPDTPPKKLEEPPQKIGGTPRTRPPRKFGGTPPVNRMNDRCLWKYYLGQNFVSAGNKINKVMTGTFWRFNDKSLFYQEL